MAIIYFLQSDVVQTLLDASVEIVVLTDDEIKSQISSRFGRPGLTIEGLRLKEANKYASTFQPRLQWLLAYLRRVGGSWRINTEAMDSHICREGVGDRDRERALCDLPEGPNPAYRPAR